MENAGAQLDNLAVKLENVEKNLLPDPAQVETNEVNGQPIEIPVLELLESVSDVTNEYVTLRRDLNEMHQLNKEMTNNLRYQVRIMNQTFHLLKQRIEAKNLQPHIKAEFAQNPKIQRQRSALSLPTSTTTLFNHHRHK